MAKLTKTQINYLENKLNRVVNDKVQEFKNGIGEGENSDKVIIDELVAGNIKLLPKTEIIKILKTKRTSSGYYRNISLYVNERISQEDKERIENEVNSRDNKIIEFRDKLNKAKTNVLDKIVLEGIDVETAIAELNKIKV